MNAQKITQTFNGLKQWQIAGSYFKLLSAQYAVTVELFYMGQKVLYAPAMEAGFYQGVLFDRVEITTPVSEEIAFLIAPDKGGSDRLAGDVSVIDGGKASTIAGTAFLANATQNAVAGGYSFVQLWNPAASGKRAIVEALYVGASLAGLIQIYREAAALPGAAAYPGSKYAGGAASTMETHSITDAALGTYGLAGFALSQYVQAVADAAPIMLRRPIVLPPGQGIIARHTVVNTYLKMSADYYEEENL